MTYQPDTNPGPARSTVGNVSFFFAVVALIIAIASLGFFVERTTSHAPAQPETTIVGQSRPPPPAAE
jgi:hypothetical protein